jgi:hypothetical protein
MKTLIENDDNLRSQLASDCDGTLAHQLVFDLFAQANRWRDQAKTVLARAEEERAIAISNAFGDAAHIVETLAPRLRAR